MQIFVKTISGKTITLEVSREDTVLLVKKKITDKEGIPPIFQCLTYGYRYRGGLENERKLFEYEIERESTLRLRLTLFRDNPKWLCKFDSGVSRFDYSEVGEKTSYRSSFKIGPPHTRELKELSNSFVIFPRYERIVSKIKNSIFISNYESNTSEKEIEEVTNFIKFNDESILFTTEVDSFVHLFDISKLEVKSKITFPKLSMSSYHLLIKRTNDSFYILNHRKVFVLSISKNEEFQKHDLTSIDQRGHLYHAICSKKNHNKIYFVTEDSCGMDIVYYYLLSTKKAVQFRFDKTNSNFSPYLLFLSSYIDKRSNEELIVISDNMCIFFDVFSDKGVLIRTFCCLESYCFDKGISTQVIFRNRFLIRAYQTIEVFDLYETKRIHLEKVIDERIKGIQIEDSILYLCAPEVSGTSGRTLIGGNTGLLCKVSVSDLEDEVFLEERVSYLPKMFEEEEDCFFSIKFIGERNVLFVSKSLLLTENLIK